MPDYSSSILFKRLPAFKDIVPVYAVIWFMTFSWTIITSFQLLSISWIFFISVWDIVGILAYQVLTNLFESLIVMAVLLVFTGLLPHGWLKDDFRARGSIVAMTFLGWLIYSYFSLEMWQLHEQIGQLLLRILVTAAVLLFAGLKFPVIRKIVLLLAERCIVFLYVLLPMAFLSLVVVLIRNLL